MDIPRKIFLTKGVGKHKEKLTSFELALRDAGIGACNLVYVSSIFPPHCDLIEKEDGLKFLNPGQIVYCVMARMETNEAGRCISSSIGVALPKDPSKHGYLSEHHCYGLDDGQAGEYAEDLAVSMLASTLGIIDFDVDKAYDEKKDNWKLQLDSAKMEEIVKTSHIAHSALGESGCWTTVVCSAVMIM